MSLTNAGKIRKHTIVAQKMEDGRFSGSVEFDWFDYQWVTTCPSHHFFSIDNHHFHVVSNDENFTSEGAKALVDAALAGKFFIFDVQTLTVTSFGGRRKS